MVKTPAARRTDAKPDASQTPASEAPASGATAPAASNLLPDAPRITVDQNAPSDPLIKRETETLRADAAASGQAPAGERPADGDVAVTKAAPADAAPVTGLGGETLRAPAGSYASGADTLVAGVDLGRPAAGYREDLGYSGERPGVERAPSVGAAIYREAGDLYFDRLFDVIVVDADGDGGVTLDRAVYLAPGTGWALDYRSPDGSRAVRLITGVAAAPYVTTAVRILGRPEIGAYAAFGVLSLAPLTIEKIDALRQEQQDAALGLASRPPAASRLADRDELVEISPIAASIAPAEVPPAAPAVQPTAVVDPAFLRVAASARVVKAVGPILTVNTEIRSEPGHDYGVRYVDIEGVPRITRVEPFIGPTSALTLVADLPAPLVGADVQIGVLGAPIDVETGQALIAGKYLSLREHGDGTATAVTVDGRKVRVGAL